VQPAVRRAVCNNGDIFCIMTHPFGPEQPASSHIRFCNMIHEDIGFSSAILLSGRRANSVRISVKSRDIEGIFEI